MPSRTLSAAIIALILSLTTMAQAQAGDRVLILAAASMRDAVEAVIASRPDPDVGPVDGVYAASSALARQVIDGAPAQLYLSANTAWMDAVEKAGLVADRAILAENRLVVIAPGTATPPPRVRDATDILRGLGDGRLAVAETGAVPAGLYAKQALTTLGVWEALAPRLAQASNVRTALLLVERGEAPLGIVYRSDALASKRVRAVWTFPADAHEPIRYPLALLTAGKDNPAARAFFAFLLSADGARILSDHGFGTD